MPRKKTRSSQAPLSTFVTGQRGAGWSVRSLPREKSNCEPLGITCSCVPLQCRAVVSLERGRWSGCGKVFAKNDSLRPMVKTEFDENSHCHDAISVCPRLLPRRWGRTTFALGFRPGNLPVSRGRRMMNGNFHGGTDSEIKFRFVFRTDQPMPERWINVVRTRCVHPCQLFAQLNPR